MDVIEKEVEVNPLLETKDIKLVVSHAGESTPSEEDILAKYSAYEGIEKEDIETKGIYSRYGSYKSVIKLRVSASEDTDEPLEEEKIPEKEVKPEESEEEEEKESEDEAEEAEESEKEESEDEEQEEPSEEEEKEVDYESIVDNTIADAKKEIEDLEDPDFDSLLEAEKENKNRKTFVSWLENQK